MHRILKVPCVSHAAGCTRKTPVLIVTSSCPLVLTNYFRTISDLATLWKAAPKSFWQMFRNKLPIQITGARHVQTWQNLFCCTGFMIVMSSLEVPVNSCMATFSWQPLEKVLQQYRWLVAAQCQGYAPDAWTRVSAGLPVAENKEVNPFYLQICLGICLHFGHFRLQRYRTRAFYKAWTSVRSLHSPKLRSLWLSNLFQSSLIVMLNQHVFNFLWLLEKTSTQQPAK